MDEVEKILTQADYDALKCQEFFNGPVLGKILILSRENAEKFSYDKPWACISIDGLNRTFTANIHEHAKIQTENRVDLLQLRFDDITFHRDGWTKFTGHQAEEVWAFVEKVWDKVDVLLIHCHAGLSRSPACGKVISEKYQPEFAKWYDQMYFPNDLVVKTLRIVGKLWPYDGSFGKLADEKTVDV